MSRQQRLGIILVTTTPQPPAPHARPCRSSSLPRVPAMAYRYLRRTKADCAFRGGNACQGIVANGLLSVVRTHAKRVQVIFACVSTAFLLKCTAFRLRLRQYLSPAFPLPSFSKALPFACDYGNTFRLRFHCLPSQRHCLSLATTAIPFACVSTAFLLKGTAFRLRLRQYLSPAFPLPSFSKTVPFACDAAAVGRRGFPRHRVSRHRVSVCAGQLMGPKGRWPPDKGPRTKAADGIQKTG